MPTTEEIIEEYRKTRSRSYGQGYSHPFGLDEVHYDINGDAWFIISVFYSSLYNWLNEQEDINPELCGTTYPHKKWSGYPRFNIHQSLMIYIQLRWS